MVCQYDKCLCFSDVYGQVQSMHAHTLLVLLQSGIDISVLMECLCSSVCCKKQVHDYSTDCK